jgi:hypothetical protein
MSQFESFIAGAHIDGRGFDQTRLDPVEIDVLVARGRRLQAQAMTAALRRVAGLPRRLLARLAPSHDRPLTTAGCR